MKITITADMKKVLAVAEMPAVRQIIADFKGKDNLLNDYAEMAARVACGGYVEKILECSAEICKNCRVFDYYAADSGNLDVWINFTAFTSEGFVMGGACLSDIWKIGGETPDSEIRKHMFIRTFRES